MKKLETHQYFWITAFFYLVLCVLWFYSDDAIVINVHDTYFVIWNFHIGLLLLQTFFIAGFIYWLSFKRRFKLINPLTKIHAITTIGSVFIYFLGSFIFDIFNDNEFPLFDNQSKFDFFTLFLIIVSGFAQIVFLINIINSLRNYFKSKN